MVIYWDPNIAVWQILHLYSVATQSINRALAHTLPTNRHTPNPPPSHAHMHTHTHTPSGHQPRPSPLPRNTEQCGTESWLIRTARHAGIWVLSLIFPSSRWCLLQCKEIPPLGQQTGRGLVLEGRTNKKEKHRVELNIIFMKMGDASWYISSYLLTCVIIVHCSNSPTCRWHPC